MQRSTFLAVLSTLAFLTAPCRAQTPNATLAASKGPTLPTATVPPVGPKASATAASASRASVAPVLDGRTDDPAWATAQVIDQFLEYDPSEGKESRFKTEVRVTYDDRYLYVLARMYDPAPDSIISLLSRRDVRTN
jgi:hypothetical protein